MKLRDFELCVSNFDKKNSAFNIQVRCLIAHVFKYYQKQDAENVKKIIIEFEEKGSDFYSGSEETLPLYENMLGIATLRREFDFHKYWRLSDIEKIEYAFKEFIIGIKDVCARESIDATCFDEISQKIKQDDYLYQGYWKKTVKSPSKNVEAKVFYKYLMDAIEIYAEIKNDGSKPQLILIEKIAPPYLYEFENAFGKFYWDDDYAVVLEHKKGNKRIRVGI
jgi:hypothetical protein